MLVAGEARMRCRYAVLTALAWFLPFALVRAADKPDEVSAAKGKLIYVRYCASCHGTTGRGDGIVATELRVPPTDLTRLAEKAGGRFPEDVVTRSIDGRRTPRVHGTPDMPVWGEVFERTEGTDSLTVDSALRRVTHYIWSLQATKG
jgi:mono/diheme cytochrome c family protein